MLINNIKYVYDIQEKFVQRYSVTTGELFVQKRIRMQKRRPMKRSNVMEGTCACGICGMSVFVGSSG